MNTITFKHPGSGFTFHIRENTSDRWVIDDVFDQQVYKFSPDMVSDGGVILDVGGNIGAFSMYAAKLCPSARVIAYEPEPENMVLFLRNIRDNGFEVDGNITVWNKAVSNERGMGKILGNFGSSRLLATGHEGLQGDYADCQTVTLADVFEDNQIFVCDFFKCDCEWSEYLIFDTTPEILCRIKRIAMEYHPVTKDEFTAFAERLARTHNVDASPWREKCTGYLSATLRD